jgi:hypothetical protein
MHVIATIILGGNLFILFAPHIGISDAGCLGKYSRIGQEKDGAACGGK